MYQLSKKYCLYCTLLASLFSICCLTPSTVFAGEVTLYKSTFDRDLNLEGSIFNGAPSAWADAGESCRYPDGTMIWGSQRPCSARVKNTHELPSGSESGFLRVTSASSIPSGPGLGANIPYQAKAGWQAYFRNLTVPTNATEVRLSFLYRSGYINQQGTLTNLNGEADLKFYINNYAKNSLPTAGEVAFARSFLFQPALGATWERAAVTFNPKTLAFTEKDQDYRLFFYPDYRWTTVDSMNNNVVTRFLDIDDVSLIAITPDEAKPDPKNSQEPVTPPITPVSPGEPPRSPQLPANLSSALGANQCRIISVRASKRTQRFARGSAKAAVSGGNPATPDRKFAVSILTTRKNLLRKISYSLDGKLLKASGGKVNIAPAMLGAKDQATLAIQLQPTAGKAKAIKLPLRFIPCKRIARISKRGKKDIRALVITRTPVKNVEMTFAKPIQFRKASSPKTIGYISLQGENVQRFPITRNADGRLQTNAPVELAYQANKQLRFSNFKTQAFSLTVDLLGSALTPQSQLSNKPPGTILVNDSDGQQKFALK